jgi:hypothetical protein
MTQEEVFTLSTIFIENEKNSLAYHFRISSMTLPPKLTKTKVLFNI